MNLSFEREGDIIHMSLNEWKCLCSLSLKLSFPKVFFKLQRKEN